MLISTVDDQMAGDAEEEEGGQLEEKRLESWKVTAKVKYYY